MAIARALANEPKILLCEEVTHALNQKAKQSILQLLQEINSQLKLTVLLITHEIEVIKSICNRVAVLHEGEIVEQNTVIEWYSNQNRVCLKHLFERNTTRYTCKLAIVF